MKNIEILAKGIQLHLDREYSHKSRFADYIALLTFALVLVLNIDLLREFNTRVNPFT